MIIFVAPSIIKIQTPEIKRKQPMSSKSPKFERLITILQNITD